MKALVWHGRRDVRVEIVPDPAIREPTAAIVRVTAPRGYELFQKKEDGVIKVVLQP